MFETKLPSLWEKTSPQVKSSNAFINAGMQKSAETLSGNGALKYSTTGNPFVDQFGKLGSYRNLRPFNEIEKDCEALWAIDSGLCTAFIMYTRMITRVTDVFGKRTKTSQKGAELKHEGIFRMMWLQNKDPKSYWDNVQLFVSVGSWKDIIQMLQYDLIYHGWENRRLDWTKFGNLILSALNDDTQRDLLKKYLPQIKAASNCNTVESQADNFIGKWICSLLFGNKEKDFSKYKKYRKLKSSGTAHEWQKLISQGKHQLIDFSKIHGRALNLIVRSKYLQNQGLKEKYEAWVSKPETEVKFTGFVHELFSNLPGSLSGLSKAEIDTINKQFQTLINKGGETEATKLIVVRDTSASMGSQASGTNMSCYTIGKALALYFSEFMIGSFKDAWIEFNSNAKMHQWKGNTPLEKWYNDHSNFVGSTNFQSVINLFGKLKRQGIPESEFPTGILCISDSEFNPGQLGKTNVETAKNSLRNFGFSNEYIDNFVIVLWNLQNNYYGRGSGEKFETYGNVSNVFYFSGYSAATVSFLTSKIKNAEELMLEALNQEIMQMIA